MSETSDRLLRGYQAQEKRFLERRFPLRFASENPTLRELYRQAKRFRWNPETDIAWSRFDPAAYPPAVREAARLVWSRRAWGTYPGLGEDTARQILRLVAGDKQRHVLFAWTLLGDRLPGLDAAGLAAVGQAVRDMLERVILAGYRNTWLLPAEAREPLLAAEALAAEHGLGASTGAQVKSVDRATLAQVRE